MSTLDERNGWTSASNAQADALCKARHQAQKGIKSEESKDASFGRRIHEAIKNGSDEGLDVAECDVYESCRKIEEGLLLKVFGGDASSVKPLYRERRLWASWAFSEDKKLYHSGQPDVVYEHDGKRLIVEYKTLPGDVPAASRNMQLRDQTVLVAIDRKSLMPTYVAVCQPLVTHTPELCLYNNAEIEVAMQDMANRVFDSNSDNPEATAGPIQCKYCLAKSKCTAYSQWSGVIAMPKEQLALVPVSQWTPEQRARFMEVRKVAQDWLDLCESECRKALEQDKNAIIGWGFDSGKSSKTVTDPQKVFDRFSAKGGTLEQFMSCIDIGLTRLKGELKKVTKTKGKELDDEFAKMIDGTFVASVSRPSMKRLEKIK